MTLRPSYAYTAFEFPKILFCDARSRSARGIGPAATGQRLDTRVAANPATAYYALLQTKLQVEAKKYPHDVNNVVLA